MRNPHAYLVPLPSMIGCRGRGEGIGTYLCSCVKRNQFKDLSVWLSRYVKMVLTGNVKPEIEGGSVDRIETLLEELVEACERHFDETPRQLRIMPNGDFEINVQVDVSYEEVPVVIFVQRTSETPSA